MTLVKSSITTALLLNLVLSQQAFAAISGSVYQDLPVTGSTANTYGAKEANESGIENITVSAVDAAGTTGSATTDATGAWSITGLSGDVRVEFTNIPTYLQPSANGANSNTTLQFVTEGDANIDLGLHDPGHFSQTNPDIMISTFRNGDGTLAGSTAPTASITSFPYLSTGSGGGSNTDYATAGNTGAIYGLAYQKDTDKLFSSAFVKRHVGLAGSLGSVFVTDSGTTTEYVDLAAAPFSINFGSVTGRDIPADLDDPSHDIDAYSKAHKAGIGDMDISPTGDALFLVNMFDKNLYKLAIGNPAKVSLSAADVSNFPIPNPSCNAGEWRPFGLGYGEGKLYAGGVCSGESGGTRSDISAYVYAFDLQSESFNTTPVLTFPLNYPRKAVNAFHSAGCPDGFQVWSDDYSDVSGYGSNNYENCYSQPSLVDITMDTDGTLLVGLRGRIADQMGRNNYPPISSDTSLKYGQMSGDLLRASSNGNGTFTLENNATSGSITGCGANNDDGPGDGEFYCEDFFANSGGSVAHHNTGEGSHITLPGTSEVVVAQMDPIDFDSQGIARFSHIDGTKIDAYEIIRSDLGNFGKGGGLGDMEFLSDPSPLEIGNRVWDDANSNGVQDAGELPIQGVVVTLNCGGLIGTSTSDASGAWLIKDGDMAGNADIPRGTVCTISVPTTEPGGKTLTTQEEDTTLGSDPDATGNFFITTGASGENNHNYDIGYRNAPACSITASAAVSACTNVGNDADTSNDTYTVELTVSGQNTSANFDYDSVPAGVSGTGIAFASSPFTTPAINIESTNSPLTLTVTDSVDGTCSTTITPDIVEPAVCSNATTGSLEITKNVTGGTDPQNFSLQLDCSDDNFDDNTIMLADGATHTVNNIPTGTNCSVTETPPSAPNGFTYGAAIITPTVTIGDGTTMTITVENPLTASAVCSVNPTVNTVCNNAGTASDPSDDTFSYTINTSGSNIGATYSISGDDTQNTLAYNTDHSFGTFAINGASNLSLTITDVDDNSCTANATATVPATCSNVVPASTVDLELTKIASSTSAISGDTITYTISVKNNGPDAATGVEVTDVLPTGVTYANDTPSQGTYTQGTGIWAVGNLANQVTATLTIEVIVD